MAPGLGGGAAKRYIEPSQSHPTPSHPNARTQSPQPCQCSHHHIHHTTPPHRSFGPHWWGWNLLLAAAPAAVLWAGLARTKSQMQAEVVRLQADVAAQKQRLLVGGGGGGQRQAALPTAAARVPRAGGAHSGGAASDTGAAAAGGGGKGEEEAETASSTEERLRRLEGQLARLEAAMHLGGGGGGSAATVQEDKDGPPPQLPTPTPADMAAELASAAMSGIRRRLFEGQGDVLVALERLRRGESGAGGAAGGREEGEGNGAGKEEEGQNRK